MKKYLLHAFSCLSILAISQSDSIAQSVITGPSSSNSPYIVPLVTGAKSTSILTAPDLIGGYKMAGTPDGLGAFDNGDGTFTLVMNHEFGNTAGSTRQHGSKGAFVSKWIIKKSDLSVISITDLIQKVKLWNTTTLTYDTYYSTTPSSLTAFNRFCSADLPAVSAFYNSQTGLGTKERIFMNGEESGTEGRLMGHIVTGPNAGTSYELPYLGKFSCENSLANPGTGDKTVVAGTDDATPGQVYFYIGTKTNSGTEIDKAGLTNGHLYGPVISGYLLETNTSIPAAGTAFTMADLGDVHNMTGATLQANSNAAGVVQFLRPEDGAWDPQNPTDFYFNTTNAFGSPSRVWKLHFSNINDFTAGGTITAVLDGTEGQQMFDNMAIDNWGHILLLEDVGNNAHNGKVWQYTIATDSLKLIAQHDTARFITGGSKFLTQDEEASGIIDVQEILGAGMFLTSDQAHYGISGEAVEGGQLLAFFNPDTYNANPEINLQGNSIDIQDGSNSPIIANNTDFGNVDSGKTVTRTFTIQSSGPAALNVTGITLTGANASEFTLVSPPTFPLSIAAGSSQVITVKFAPNAVGLRKAVLNIMSNDFDEKTYDVAIQGLALNALPSGINTTNLSSATTLYPNPTNGDATLAISLKKAETLVISVMDIQGNVVIPRIEKQLQAGSQEITLNTSNLANGNYFVLVASSTQALKMKLVVAH